MTQKIELCQIVSCSPKSFKIEIQLNRFSKQRVMDPNEEQPFLKKKSVISVVKTNINWWEKSPIVITFCRNSFI